MTRDQRTRLYYRRIKRGRIKPFKVWYMATVAATGDVVRVSTVEFAGSWKAVQRWHRMPDPRFLKKGRIHQRH